MRSRSTAKLLSLLLALALLAGCQSSSGGFKPKYETSFEPYELDIHDMSFYMPFSGAVRSGVVDEIDPTVTSPGQQFYAYYGMVSKGLDWFWMTGYYEESEDAVNIGNFDFETCSEIAMYMMGKKIDMYIQRYEDRYPTNLTYNVEDHTSEGYARIDGMLSVSTLDDSKQEDWPFIGFAALSDETAMVSLFFDLQDGANADLLNTYREEALGTLEVHGRKLLA